jgi:hypothetical protein
MLLILLVSLVSHRTRLTDKPCLQSTSRDSASSVKLCTSLRAPHDEAFVFSSSSLKQKKRNKANKMQKNIFGLVRPVDFVDSTEFYLKEIRPIEYQAQRHEINMF